MTQIILQLVKLSTNQLGSYCKNLQLVGQMTVIGRKFKQFSSVNLKPWQWFLLLYVAGTVGLLLLVTLLKVAMKLI